ncbi:Alpha/Beta hydrolase protein [Neohortaea acidophila]|uniref:Alpha/Beta hydrolase protein n=1 Tax=Neohortaea acidophila TaxID=245834 RepID=A0A6A6PXZ0_9PEZI|nr:Alpha/Beta hydrolase protein [Neohortaea acidophila]KAF2484882.1 Alpha/Beta hydrolase protein [Neohortaea acidophila]
MDRLPQLGTAISDVVMPTYQTYAPLLLRQEEAIRSTKCTTFAYGPHPRQQLDIYSPPANSTPVTGNRHSLLVFLYGGGFVRGDKSNKDFCGGLVYANLGHYFSQNLGFHVAIVDYRLISHDAKFPSGGEDLALALEWLVPHFSGSSNEPLDLFLMGNSAGAVHTSTYLLAEQFAARRQKLLGAANLHGVILVGAPYHFEQAVASRKEILQAYYGDRLSQDCPFGLLKQAKQTGSIEDLGKVEVLVMTATLDPEDEIVKPGRDFVKEWRSTTSVQSKLHVNTIEGHNHISPVLGLGTGLPAEEAWGRDVVEFIAQTQKK